MTENGDFPGTKSGGISAALAATHRAAFAADRPWSAAEFESLLAAKGAILIGDAQSFALGRVVVDEVEILTIATHPRHARRGLARERLSRLLAEARSRGAGTAHLEVAADNAPALALYRATGFAEAGRRRAYYARESGKVDAILMHLDLTLRRPASDPADAPASHGEEG